MDQLQKRWHRYHFKNLTYLIVGVFLAIFIFKNPVFRSMLSNLGTVGYLGAFFGGMLFISTFTFSIGTVILFMLVEYLHPIEIGLIAGLGAVVGDLIIFKYIRNKELSAEIKHFFNHFGGDKISHLLHSKYFSWTLPVVGALIIASPLPDELGVSLMGISRMKTHKFILLSFLLNSVGIFLTVSAGVFFKL